MFQLFHPPKKITLACMPMLYFELGATFRCYAEVKMREVRNLEENKLRFFLSKFLPHVAVVTS